ncbi:MAG: glycosyl hydrolase family 17 protein [Promethearchaeota archaeon]
MKNISYLTFFSLLGLIIIFSHLQPLQMNTSENNLKAKSALEAQASTFDFHGLCYGAYRYFGPPGEWINPQNVREDLGILKELNVTNIRTYGMNYGQNVIPGIAHENGIDCATGIWIVPNNSLNNHYLNSYEISQGLAVADISSALIVGNEVLLREDMTLSQLIKYIEIVNNQTSVPVTTAEPWHIWDQYPQLVNACDVLFVHVYSYWEGKPSPTYGSFAAEYTIERIEELQTKYPDKEIFLAEAGWPSGPKDWDPDRYSEQVQKEFYNDLLPMLAESKIKSYLFEAFDEAWKINQEGPVGEHWGIFREERTPKPAAEVLVKFFGGSVKWPAPTIISPEDFETYTDEDVNISWMINDIDNTSGTYGIYLDNTLLGQQDEIWENGTTVNITVNTENIGSFNYTIVFTDGISIGHDTVIVSVVKHPEPTINSPEDIETNQNEDVNITWIILDSDTIYGTYTVYLDNFVFGSQNDIWKNNTAFYITVTTGTAGTFNYTIVFTDGVYTRQDTVLVTVHPLIISTTSTTSATTASPKTTSGFTVLIWIISIFALLAVYRFNSKKHSLKKN